MADKLIDLIVGVGAALVSALVVIIFIRLKNCFDIKILRRAVKFSVVPNVNNQWSIAFSGGLTPEIRSIEGGQHNPQTVYDHLVKNDGVDISETCLRLTIESLVDQVVTIRDIRVEKSFSPPLAGTRIDCPPAGANSSTILVFNLEQTFPVAIEWQEDGSRQEISSIPFFKRSNVTLKKGEMYDFIIIGQAKDYLVEWIMYLDVEVGKYHQSLKIDDLGKAFKTTGIPKSGFAERVHWAWYENRQFQPLPNYEDCKE